MTEATHISETTKEKLRQTIEHIERLEADKAEIAQDVKDVYSEAKAFGFDTKALRQVIRLRKLDRAEREEMDMILDTYLLALGEI